MVSDEENNIIKRILEGNREAFAVLVDTYKNPVFNLAYRMTGQYQEADDLAQEIFIKAYESLSSFETNRKFFPWLYTIALNAIRNHLKKKKLWSATSVGDHYPSQEINDRTDPEAMVCRQQESERLAAFIKKLPYPQLEAINLRYNQGLAFEDIADILDISLSAAKMRVYRGLKKLAELMNTEKQSHEIK
jgi:RNA polymerase sigma-70 factor (ECF subfamily)